MPAGEAERSFTLKNSPHKEFLLIPRREGERKRWVLFPQYRSDDETPGCIAAKEEQEIPCCWNPTHLSNWRFSLLGSEGEDMMAWVTLSYKCLARVEEDLAALHDHTLDCQVLPDVFSLAHLVMHDPVRRGPHRSHLIFIELFRINFYCDNELFHKLF